MKVVYGGRQSGKTTTMLKAVEGTKIIILCDTKARCRQILSVAVVQKIKVGISQIKTYAEYQFKKTGTIGKSKVMLHDIEVMLPIIMNSRDEVVGFSVLTEEEEEEKGGAHSDS